MMGEKLITVLGITGTQGGSVAKRFLNNSEWKVRGVTRNPESDRAKVWTAQGVEMVQANQDDINSLKRAFRGAHAIFAVTYWASNYQRVYQEKVLQDEAAAMGRSIGEYAGDLELRRPSNTHISLVPEETMRSEWTYSRDQLCRGI